jgi:hypothetical protein
VPGPRPGPGAGAALPERPRSRVQVHRRAGECGGVHSLPQGARTDDDTDLEWVYVVARQDEDRVLLPGSRIAELWRERINRRIWCSNRYARGLTDLGLEPPVTGSRVLNTRAEFNISGQFLSETFGLIPPAKT